MGLWSNISARRAAKIRSEVAKEVTEELKSRLTPKIRRQIRNETWDKALREAKAQVEARLQEDEPTHKQRRGFVDFVKETELDAYAQATVASGSADKYASRARWARWLLGPLPWMMFLGTPVALYSLWQWLGTYQAVEFVGAAVGLLVVLLTLVVTNRLRQERCRSQMNRLYQIASRYLVVAERAKSFRLVHAERLETKAELDDLMVKLQREKIDLDDKFHPRVVDVDKARDSVRHRISVEGLNIDIDERAEFDARLEAAEAEAEAEEVPVRRVARA